MFISVDLPAPFSPSSACTSPSSRSKLTLSLASTPGNCLVIPMSARTVPSDIGGDSFTRRAGLAARPSQCDSLRLLEGGRRLDLAGLDLQRQRVHLRDVRPR